MISKEEIEKLSELSRVKLEAEEKKELQKDLGEILDYFNKLKSLKIEETENGKLNGFRGAPTNEFREDLEEKKMAENAALLEQAPQKENGRLKVKKII